jgi:c-di-AMP phosphodiesterase-like protein
MPLKKEELKTGIIQSTDTFEKSEKYKKQKKKVFNIAMPDNYKKILQEHFNNKGLSMMSGIRTVLYDYMKKNDLI